MYKQAKTEIARKLTLKVPVQEAISKNSPSAEVTDVRMGDMPCVSVAKIKELLERRQSTRPKFVRQQNAFGKVASIVQEFNSGTATANHE